MAVWDVVITLAEVIEEEVALEADVVEVGGEEREKHQRCSASPEENMRASSGIPQYYSARLDKLVAIQVAGNLRPYQKSMYAA